MKKLLNKIANNKILLTISMAILCTLFMFLTTGLGGIVPGWHGIVRIITQLIRDGIEYTSNGYSALGEAVWFACIIPVIILFKNKYIFTQKKMGFFKSLSLVWIDLIMCLAFLLLSVFSVGIKNMDLQEVGSMFVLYLFVGLFEELLCRGWILNEFLERFGNNRKNVLFSIFTSAVIFGVIHIVNFFGGQDLFSTIIQIINAINGGIVFAALYYRTKNIWASVALHTIWDFTLSLSTVNANFTCASIEVTQTTIGTAIAGCIFAVIVIIPEMYNWLLLINKKDINDLLPEENRVKLTDKQLQNNKLYKIIISVLAGVYLVGFVLFFALAGILGRDTNNVCTHYPNVEISNYTEEVSYLTEYSFTVGEATPEYAITNCAYTGFVTDEAMNCIPTTISKYTNVNIKINNEHKIVVTNEESNYSKVADILDVYRLYAIERDDSIEIYFLALNEDGEGVVYTVFINTSDNVLYDDELVDYIASNIAHIELPPIVKIGGLRISGSDRVNPLFISQRNYDYFINDKEEIVVYER